MRNIFEDLFVLEMANNHWGSLDRGLAIISAYSKVVRMNNIRAAIKLQFRNLETFIHKDFLSSEERYIKKTLASSLGEQDLRTLIEAVRRSRCLAMATPFDEISVGWCRGLDLIKIASSDINDWFLIEAVAKLGKPVIVSTAGSSLKDIDDLVLYFEHRDIPLAINHCVALYPTEDGELELNQIDFLRNRYPGHVIGLSTHEHTDWQSSMLIAYAKGARTFERHVDIDDGNFTISPYCSLPRQIDEWFKAWKKAKQMCGADGGTKRIPCERELQYLDKLVRGAYAKRDLPKGHILKDEDLYLAIPLQKGQMSCREYLQGYQLSEDIKKDAPVMLDMLNTAGNFNAEMMQIISGRGI